METISYNFEAEHDAGTYQKYFITSPENEIAYTAYIYNEYCYIYVGNAGGFSIPTYVQGGAVTTVAEYTYDAVGNLVSETKNNGTSTLYTYNNAGLPQTMQNKRGDTVLSGYTYSYFLDGNIKSITEADGKTTNYTYDKLGRVTKEEKIDNGTTFVIQYTYDSRGNRASKTENGIRTTYTYDLGNRLTAESSTGKVVTYSYDDNGNRCITYVNNNFAGVYAYDLFNKQISYTANNIGYTYYTYRPDGLRHSVGNNKHVWDGNNITAEKYYSSVTLYVYGIALIKSGTRYYLYSWHGDVIALINLAGSITKTYEYDAFGVEDDIDDSDSNPWRYCGEYYDKETKELYLRARYYDSVTGTFTQEDPIKDGNNWYSYCMGNPVVFTDPSGLKINLRKILQIAAIAAVTVVAVAGVIATAGGLAVAVGATLGVSAAASTVIAGAAVSVVAAANIAVGASEITEVITENYNPIRDDLLGGNQEAYDTAKIALSATNAAMAEIASSMPQPNADTSDDEPQSTPSPAHQDDEPKIHGNSTKSTKPQHGYEIYNKSNNDVVKTGISGQKLNANGTSPRANVQVNAFNRQARQNLYTSRVVATSMPGRKYALEWERANAQKLLNECNSMSKHIRPRH